MLTPEERKAKREWEESQLTEDQKLLRRAKWKKSYRRRRELLKERDIINGWKK